MRVRLPLSAPLYRGVVKLGNTADSNPLGVIARAGATPAAATNHAAVRGTVDRAVLKTAAPFGAWACNSPRPHQFFRRVVEWIHTSLRNSRAKAHAGANPVSPTNFSALSSNEHRRPASQAGNTGASPVEATNFAV